MVNQDFAVESNRVMLIAVQLPSQSEQEILHSLEELASLASSAGFQIAAQIIQIRPQIHPATYVGKGKISQIKETIHRSHIDLIIIDGPLTPKQEKNLEAASKCLVWDRTQLILEIFAQNARTYEAKRQIELAQLQYTLPRLVGLWMHLDRERGGIGASRGMGEKQIETDRRVISTRIAHLKEELKRVANERKIQKKRRGDCLQVSLIGYTNAGKSTIMNALTDSELLVKDKLFATLDSTTRLLDEKNRPEILLSDTVGFIKNLPHELIASFRSTLEIIRDADLLLHVVDVNAIDYAEHIDTALQVLDDLQAHCIPQLLLFNKIDRVESPTRLPILKKKYPEALFVSAFNGSMPGLREEIVRFFEKKMDTVEVLLDYQNSHNLAHIYELSRVDSIEYKNDGIHLTLTSSTGNLDRLRHHIGPAYFQEEL